MAKKQPKVICIGWHKTGTSTMGLALLELGYKVLGAREDMAKYLLKGDITTPLKLAGKFDALQDVPWAALYKELDKAYPGSKFILTLRDEDSWLNSAKKHFKDYNIPLHEWLYSDGVLEGNEELYLNRYKKHYAEIKTYFAGREKDLLVMNFKEGDAWEKLCGFLDKPLPKKAFPHENKGNHSLNTKEKLIRVIRNGIPKPIRKLRVKVLEKLGLHHGTDRFNNSNVNRAERKDRKP